MITVVLFLLLLIHGERPSNGIEQIIEQPNESYAQLSVRRPRASSRLTQPFTIECDNTKFDIKTKADIAAFARSCPSPKVLKLLKPEILPAQGMTASEFYSFVKAPVLHMCIRVQLSSLTVLDLATMERLEPTCKGPALIVQQNDRLQTIKFGNAFMTHVSRAKSIRIRGNRRLSDKTIKEINTTVPWFVLDLQEPGECGLPLEFKTTAVLEGCKKVYGTILVSRTISKVERSSKVTAVELVGCLQIVNTILTNVDFLEDIATFTLIEKTCSYEIFKNPRLCIKEPLRLKKKFPRLSIVQSNDCYTICEGGRVDDVYLDMMYGCKEINGSLIIRSLRRRPSRIDNLDSVTKIRGTLEIKNTKSLGDFSMANLKEVTSEKGPAIHVTGNARLKSLSFPRLNKLESPDDIKVDITNNPRMGMKKQQVLTLYKLAHGKHHTRIEYTDSSSIFDRIENYKMYIIIALLVLLILLLLLCISALLIAKHIKKRQIYNKDGFPYPPYRLEKPSKEILAGWVKEITNKNPLIWRCMDREVIWPYHKGDGTHKDIEVLVANNASFLKEHMLPLAANASIPGSDNFLLSERVKAMVSKDVVIMIGSEREPSCVLPHLPHEVSKEHTYKYLGTTHSFKLIRSKKMAPCTVLYTYDVEKKPKDKPAQRRTLKVYYYRWEKRRLPVEFDEILQVAMLYKPEYTVCVSERRKEVFSLIHMLHTFCHTLQENIGLVDALQLHTEKCNGSVLDRNELVYVMAVIMEWAYQSRSVPPNLKQNHVEWCHSYAIMAKFMRNNPNIKWIHPDYLTKLDPKVKQTVIHDGFTSSPRFSPRDAAAVKDPFHRKGRSRGSEHTKRSKGSKGSKERTKRSKSRSKDSRSKSSEHEEHEEQKLKSEDDKEFWLKQNTARPISPSPMDEKRDRIVV
ncbi:hypothetical protein GCK32_003717 [Trichostrongylus colubriformis]|uniref:Receptor L-domain domain-containing protein n=1 Tax=Trichostrongylus colubriformis TaxID=6319 RepID=A0AAN8FWV4_TRICO